MERTAIKAKILALAADILVGKATKEEIKQVTKLAIDNDCQDILTREFKDITQKLHCQNCQTVCSAAKKDFSCKDFTPITVDNK